jgi:hypothetical protein
MPGIFERISSLSGTELAKATNLAHNTFQGRMAEHGHTGRALVETVAHVCRNHPGLVGLGVGLMVEQLLAHEKKHFDQTHTPDGAPLPGMEKHPQGDNPPIGAPTPHPLNAHVPYANIRLSHIRPGHIAGEVFGGLVLLKIAATGIRMFRHKHQGESWFQHAARIHLFSGSLGAYYLAKSLKQPRPSAWTNAAAALFLTDALKPVLKRDKNWRPPVEPHVPARAAQVAEVAPVAPQTAAPGQRPQTAAEMARAAAMYQASPAQPAAAPPSQPEAQSFEGHGQVTQPVSLGDPTQPSAANTH